MNLRMKAKRFKRLYEASLPTHADITLKTTSIDRLRAQTSVPMKFATGNKELVKQAVVRELGNQIANSLDEYVDYTVEEDYRRAEYKVTAEVMVVRKWKLE